ncbi:beta-galactosidase [Acutalibacter sp. LFL-21]|uniref:glycoside hydrolase family 2 protein n=1 Tax=Acutalibacter sp. LFL-21 TaxID=2983399 RepID=UPI0021D66DF6|nr:sugar-binding domain-containing protein [Acutalibacter sp. LFL-21]MCU7651221.1 beta-galactosidase [Acutalibacter sp. LFL-21]
MNIPRAEHPNPQWERETWKNLNGPWEFEFDFGCSAVERRLWEKKRFDREILVPFCPESRLSGIGYTDFISGVAYRRNFELSQEELSGRVLLHFGAVDYEASVYVNGTLVGSHKGGYTSFCFDITKHVAPGPNTLFVAVKDDVRSGLQPKGKQAHLYASSGCDYTRTIGIWQTVWLEFVPERHIQSAKYYPDPANGKVTVTGLVQGQGTLQLTALWEDKPVGEAALSVEDGFFTAQLDLSETHLWEPGKGGLYTLLLSFGEDRVKSYFGLRTAKFQGRKFLLNGKSLFQRFVLDQGFYPDGIYTAPTEEDLVKDIQLSFAAGFNGARLHEKVFEARFLYHCDRLGYLVWGEYPNWGLDHAHPLSTETYLNQWSEAVERDFNHPAIIGWCPFNETWGYREEREKNALLTSLYKLTKRLDPTRPCIDSSGNYRVLSEVYDIHDYDQDTQSFQARWDGLTDRIRETGGVIPAEDPFFNSAPEGPSGRAPFFNQPYDNQPIFVSEYGGIRWPDDTVEGWGYGNASATPEEFFARYKGLTEALLNNPEIFGFCYTQLYDVEQEVNGLYTYGRVQKFDISLIQKINQQKAAIED